MPDSSPRVSPPCGSDPAPAARATGLDVPAAKAEAGRLLGEWPAAPSPAQQRHLAALVAKIRDVLGRRPGARLLAIVGASHNGCYEAYFDQMHDMRLVAAFGVLR